MSNSQPPFVSANEILDYYDAFFIDAYGVLVNAHGPLPHASEFLNRIRDQNKPFFIVTNDASRSPQTCSERFHRFGLNVDPEFFITSGSLLIPFFQEHNLLGAKTMVFGPSDSVDYVRDAGGDIVPISMDSDPLVVVAADDDGYPFLESIDVGISVLYRRIDRGDEVILILPNPDLVYPKRPGEYGFTSGAVSLLLEAALQRRYPQTNWKFIPLGKPHKAMFEEAQRRVPGLRSIMIGDQMQTDILGARRMGLDAALLLTGISKTPPSFQEEMGPTHLLQTLSVS